MVVCDVEGYEEYLLDPAIVPSLSNATILVEMHDFVRPGVTTPLAGAIRADSSHPVHPSGGPLPKRISLAHNRHRTLTEILFGLGGE